MTTRLRQARDWIPKVKLDPENPSRTAAVRLAQRDLLNGAYSIGSSPVRQSPVRAALTTARGSALLPCRVVLRSANRSFDGRDRKAGKHFVTPPGGGALLRRRILPGEVTTQFGHRLVRAQPFMDDPTQQIIAGPGEILRLHKRTRVSPQCTRLKKAIRIGRRRLGCPRIRFTG